MTFTVAAVLSSAGNECTVYVYGYNFVCTLVESRYVRINIRFVSSEADVRSLLWTLLL